MADSSAPNGYLDPSQGNALVYSTLCGFMLIGLWAGYNTRSKREFISGVRTQSGMCGLLTAAGPLALNWIASSACGW